MHVLNYGLYLHVPYCRSRCRYCDFYTRPGSRAVPEAYVDALLRDFACYAPRDGAGAPVPPATVYFGGGTPGLLSPAQVGRVLAEVRPAPGAEITLEANPGGATPGRLAGWRQAGVNRLSLGVQTARDESLKRMGRLHTAEDAARALRDAGAAGFKDISGDIMLALPGYTTAEFDETLDLLAEGGVTHVSAYLLKLEPGTRWGAAPPQAIPDADAAADFYLYAAAALKKAGYARYEISNFARPGHEGRHNLIYWDAGNWLGLGPAAHSCLAGRRFSFAPDTDAFLRDESPPVEEGVLDAGDYIMLRLRLEDGLDEVALARRFGGGLGAAQAAELTRLAEAGLARKTPGGWALTGRGMLVQNAILARLLE